MINVGESPLWHISRKQFINSTPKCRTHLKYFSGGRTKEGKPDIVVMHIDSDDIDFPQLPNNTVENIRKDIINIDQKFRESRVSKVIISFVLVKIISRLQNLLGT